MGHSFKMGICTVTVARDGSQHLLLSTHQKRKTQDQNLRKPHNCQSKKCIFEMYTALVAWDCVLARYGISHSDPLKPFTNFWFCYSRQDFVVKFSTKDNWKSAHKMLWCIWGAGRETIDPVSCMCSFMYSDFPHKYVC